MVVKRSDMIISNDNTREIGKPKVFLDAIVKKGYDRIES